jgi:regulator of nucleoside diphosphate kinase
MQTIEHKIIVTDTDLERLMSVVDQNDTSASAALEAELQRATVVKPAVVPPDVVTMDSELVYEDIDTHTRRQVRLVYPKDADASHGRVSVLAPIGSALLGLRVGQSIEWVVPNGRKRIRVVEIRYQPEASGDTMTNP